MNVIVCLGFVLGALSAAATVFHTKPRQRVTLECGVDSYSRSVAWSHRDELIIQIDKKSGFPRKGPAAIKERTKLKRDKNLEISDVRREDAGAFTCEADGRSHAHTLLVVSVSASPSEELQPGSKVTLQCEVAGLNPDSTVQWMRPDGSAHEGSDTVHLNPVAASDSGTWECAFSHGGETYREKLDVRVKDPVSPTSPAVRTSEFNNGTPCPSCGADPLGWWGPLGWWLWAAAGAGGLVVLLLMVLVIVLCRRIRRRKRKWQNKMKNGQRSARSKTYCQCNCRPAAEKPQPGRQKARPSTLAQKPLLRE
ncbi:T-cell surface glycoprotein CD4-like [Hippoglossus hippoglossus]|uniref:T-cell surface glycoprotein CD4-2 n=1 Tax=Hippoglossus hippoglossus TaxID=8267 RepID=E5E7T4_HIPHI|nr:T-cell surface glycoprotein CD4-like [Hippoglossus hippoglossus]XP_034467040.1 T-cell surface glycoprotein CD4-like [Hippoglossus hippoglossus]ADP55206.1 T-cell surface glycoprotein CD4-2 [Hippoglossus hippoglossus]ADP55207.1 T-cell surface glycoprotein CD4-2 [Hippoglossus hippoglossus]